MPVMPNPRLREFPVLVLAWTATGLTRDDDRGVLLPHGVESTSKGQIMINEEGSYTVKAVLRAGNVTEWPICYSLAAGWSQFGETEEGSASSYYQQIVVDPFNVYMLTPAITCASVPAGYIMVLSFTREGDNVLDVDIHSHFFVGWLIDEA